EEAVQLVAPPAPPAGDDLVEDMVVVEDVLDAAGDVEVLEGHSEPVRAGEVGEHVRARLTRAGVTDPRQIRINVHIRTIGGLTPIWPRAGIGAACWGFAG